MAAAAGSAAATRRPPTRPRSTPCAAMLDTVAMDGVVVIGEGEKDEAPMLYNGEEVGNGQGPEVDVAVDPLEGTRLCALGQPNAIAVIAVAERGTMFFPGAAVYMEKIAVGPEAIDVIDINAPPTENVRARRRGEGQHAARRRRRRPRARPARRPDRRAARGGREGHLIRDGDVAPAIAAAQPGTGRRHALRHRRHARGRHLGRGAEVRRRRHPGTLWPRNDEERQALLDAGLDPERVLPHERPRRRATTSSSPRPASPTGALLQRRPLHAGTAPSPTRSSCARAPGRCAASSRSIAREALRADRVRVHVERGV